MASSFTDPTSSARMSEEGWGELAEPIGRLREWIADRCVITSAMEHIVDSRGRPQAWVFDLRPALLDGPSALLIARCFWRVMAPVWPFQVAGVELAGAPLLGAIIAYGAVLGYPVSGVILRRERKTYGRQRAIEGELRALPVVLVDDMLNSGRALLRSAVTLQAEGAQLSHVFTVVDFDSPLGRAQIEALGVEATHLFKLADFRLGLPQMRSAPKPAPPLQVRWSFAPAAPSYGFVARKGAPVVAGDRVLHATEDGRIYAIDIAQGDILWEREVAQRSRKGVWSTPAADGGAAYVGSYDGAVLKLDLRDGSVLWRFEGAEWIGSSPCLGPGGEALYIGVEWAHAGGAGGVVRLDAATGVLAWEHPVPAQVHASPRMLADGDLVCGANDGRLRRFSPGGALRWNVAVGGDVKGGVGATADEDRLIVGTFDGAVAAVEAATGEPAWRVQTAGAVFATPLVRDGLAACASTDGRLYLLDAATGAEVAAVGLGAKLFAAPVFDGEAVVIGTAAGRLVRLSWPGMEILTEHQFAERIVSEVAIAPDVILAPTFDGRLFAIERESAEGGHGVT